MAYSKVTIDKSFMMINYFFHKDSLREENQLLTNLDKEALTKSLRIAGEIFI